MLYKTLILPMLIYSAESWNQLSTDTAALGVFERKVIGKIFVLVRVGDDFHSRSNNKLYDQRRSAAY